MTYRFNLLTRSAGAALLAASVVFAPAAQAGDPLRVCADPDNLPFSKSEGPERGLYVELAELVAQKINAAPVQYNWYLTFYQRRALRNTSNDCDAVFALPTDADYRARGLQKSAAFLELSYAVVSRPEFTFSSLEELKTRRLGVQFQSTPHIHLSGQDGVKFTTYKAAEEVFAALEKGDIEAGFMWGPVAGFDNQRLHGGKFKVTALSGKDMTGQVSVAVRRDKPELLQAIDKALVELQPDIAKLAAKYAFPSGPAVKLNFASLEKPSPNQRVAATSASIPAQWLVKTQANATDGANSAKPAAKPPAKPAPKAKTEAKSDKPAASTPAVAEAAPPLSPTAQLGKVRFNDQCSHCHGSDGISFIRERDVRRLKSRYDTKWKEMALTTIKNGRPDAGMPTWKDILKENEIEQLLAFIETVQK